MRIYDISIPLRNGMAIYPSNAPFEQGIWSKLAQGRTNLSAISMGAHSGTHVDSKRHVKNGAAASWPLQLLVGKCRVLDLTAVEFGEGIGKGGLAGKKIAKGDIVVLKTRNSARGFAAFHPDYVYLAESGAEYLVEKGAKAVGIDSIAVQKYHAGNQRVHGKLLLSGVPVIEGLNLKGVPAGEYGFFCLPLKLECDGLPARAILVRG